MSFDERVLSQIIRAARETKLEVIVVGNAGAALHDVTVSGSDEIAPDGLLRNRLRHAF